VMAKVNDELRGFWRRIDDAWRWGCDCGGPGKWKAASVSYCKRCQIYRPKKADR
jgi:hypothetical protein